MCGGGGKLGEKSAESRGRKPGENSANYPGNSRAPFPPDLRIIRHLEKGSDVMMGNLENQKERKNGIGDGFGGFGFLLRE